MSEGWDGDGPKLSSALEEMRSNFEKQKSAGKNKTRVALVKEVIALEAENARLKKDLERLQMAWREEVELNKNVVNIAYFKGVAEGRKHKDALVAAAYRAAAEICAKHEDVTWDLAMDEILALTPADAEKALRKFGMEVAKLRDKYSAMGYVDAAYQVLDEQIVDEVMRG